MEAEQWLQGGEAEEGGERRLGELCSAVGVKEASGRWITTLDSEARRADEVCMHAGGQEVERERERAGTSLLQQHS